MFLQKLEIIYEKILNNYYLDEKIYKTFNVYCKTLKLKSILMKKLYIFKIKL